MPVNTPLPTAPSVATPHDAACQALEAAQQWGPLLQRALQWQAQHPGHAQALYCVGLAYHRLGQAGPALAFLSEAICRSPHHLSARLERASVYQALQQWLAAQADLAECLQRDPYHPLALQQWAQTAKGQQQWAQVSVALERLADVQPDLPGLALAQATAWLHQRCMDKATPCFERALEQSGNGAAVKWEYAMQLLMMEDFARGWDYHEARFDVFGRTALNTLPLFATPWQGQDLAGKTLLVHGEQGVGDEIMFASILPELIAQAKQVVLACHPNLVDVFQMSFPGAMVIAHPRGQPQDWQHQLPPEILGLLQANPIDFQCSTSSLARPTRRSVADFPGIPYLRVGADRQRKLKQWLDQAIDQHPPTAGLTLSMPGYGLRLGLAWSGNLSNPTAALRSMPLAQLRPLRAALPGATFVSLQGAQYAGQIDTVPDMHLIDSSPQTHNFADLAALMTQLDGVISVDTSYVHLAGALGLPTWLMQCRRAEWRWGWQRKHPLWYPSVHIIWQPTDGDWASVVQTLSQRLLAQPMPGRRPTRPAP